MSASVLIVGAGPSGLILALSLLRNRVPVRIIEKEISHKVGERGAGMMPRTFELHNLLGTLPDILKLASPIAKRRIYEVGGMKVVREEDPMVHVEESVHMPYAKPMMLGQNHLEAILRAHLQKYGVEVELATCLEKFEQNDDFVTAHLVKSVNGNTVSEKARFDYLVGADGAHSTVRKHLGLSFVGETIEGADMIVGDIVLEGLERDDFWHFWGTPQTKMLSMRPSGQDPDIFNFIIGGAVDLPQVTAPSCREEVVSIIKEMTGRSDLKFGEIKWISRYRPNIRMVDKFHVGRVFIAGDAAHCHSPAGGQGMNSSSQDAFNLGWKLSLASKNLAPPSLLDSYTEERIPIIAEMLNLTTQLFRTNIKPENEKERAEAWKRREEFYMFGVNCRGSSLVIDDGLKDLERESGRRGGAYNKDSATAARAGDRAPDAPELLRIYPEEQEEKTSLFEVFGDTYHTVLVFGGSKEQHKLVLGMLANLPKDLVKSILIVPSKMATEPRAEGFDTVLDDTKGYAFAGYHIPEQTMVVTVRPDGVVGARLTALENVDRYFSKIFI